MFDYEKIVTNGHTFIIKSSTYISKVQYNKWIKSIVKILKG